MKEGGIVIPSSAEIYLSTCINSSFAYLNKYTWKDAYGFEYTPIEKDETFAASLDCVASLRIKADSPMICKLDFTKITVNDLSIISSFTIKSCNDEPFTVECFILLLIPKFPNSDENQQLILNLNYLEIQCQNLKPINHFAIGDLSGFDKHPENLDWQKIEKDSNYSNCNRHSSNIVIEIIFFF